MVAVTNNEAKLAHGHLAHPEDYFSILLALLAAIGSAGFFWLVPGLEPGSHISWTAPAWIAGSYLFLQIFFMLVSATQIRVLGVIDSIVAILPFVVGLVLVAEWLLGHLPFSSFQLNALALLLATSLGEFLFTVWVRFVINRRTIAIDAS